MESQIAKVAAENPELRKFLVPLLKEAAVSQARILLRAQLNAVVEELNALQEVRGIFQSMLHLKEVPKEKMYTMISDAQRRLSDGSKAYDHLNAISLKMEALISRDEF
jgi:hypothetical protein